jgi:S-layer protein
MAYTTAQLVSAYTAANLGKAPDAATTLTLDAYATQSQPGGSLSDTQALANTLKLVNSTTAVAIEAYQFFTGRAPSVAGLTYLVNSTTNANDLNDAYFAKFSQENRFINFSINLATGTGEGAAAFKAAYGDTATSTVTYAQAVASAYDKIIGNAAAAAAGVDVAAAVAYLTRQANIDYLTAFVKANTGLTADADINLAVKAALIGEVLNVATVSGIGLYANATNAMIVDLSDGTLATDNAAGVNLLTAYPGAGGGVVGTTYVLTASIDTLTGTNNNDTFNGSATAVANSSTVNALDSIDGGAGTDTLNLSNAGAATDVDTSKITVKNVEVVNLASVTGLAGGAADFSTWAGLGQANVSLSAPAAAQTVTAANTTNVALTVAGAGTNNIAVQGGGAVTVTEAGQTTGTISVGTTTAATGAVTISNTAVYNDAANANVAVGAITVKGGTTVTVSEATGITAANTTNAVTDTSNFTVTQGAVSVTGTSATTAVTVNQAANVAVVNGVVAVVENNVVTFGAGLTAGQTVTIGGLTYTSTGATNTAQLATAFANLANGATTGGGTATGTYSGTFTGWTTGAAAGSAVTVSSVSSGNVTDLVVTDPNGTLGGGGSNTKTDGVAAVTGKVGVAAGVVTITDVNATDATKAGTIKTVSLTNGTDATITANAVTTLNLNNAAGVKLTALGSNALVSKALTLNLTGGTSGVTDTNNVNTSLTVNATADSSFSFVDTSLTSLTVSGSKLATLTNAAALTALKTVTVTGAGGFTGTGTFNAATVTLVDTTGSTGTTTVAIDGSGAAKTAFKGGAGIDVVTLVNALPATGSVQLGAGNDRLLGTTAVAVSTTAVIDGGDGVDAVASTLINNGNASMFKNFEVLNLAGGNGSNFDVSLLTGSTIQTLEVNGGPGAGNTATYGGLTTAQTTSVTGTSAGTVVLAFAAATGTADAYTIGFNAVTTGTATAKTAINAGTISIAGIEAVTVNSGAAAGFTTNTLALTDNDARTLTVTGSQDLVLSFTQLGTGNATTGFSLLDASAATGAVSVNTTGIQGLTAGFAVKTGTGADTITVAANQITTITTGAGKDTVNVALSVDKIGSGATTAVYTTIADAVAGSGDKIAFKDNGTEVFNSTKVNVDAVTDLGAALTAATQNAGGANSQITWFQYGGNTYVVENNTAAGFDAGDIVVKLTGLVDLSNATNSGTHVLTI